MTKVLIGFVNRFNYLHDKLNVDLSGEPKEGSIYRVLYDEKENELMYQLYLGKETNKSRIDTIFLGDSLVGVYKDNWEFDIQEITKDNYLDFNYKPEELPVLKTWLDSDNEDLKELMKMHPRRVDIMHIGDQPEGATEPILMDEAIQRALNKTLAFKNEYQESAELIETSLNIIVDKDLHLFMVLAQLLGYLASTFGDKYEASTRSNFAKEFLVTSGSADTACFNALKYIQRYATVGFEKSGKVVDIHKAIHYLMFELQRAKNQKDNAKNS